MAGARRMGHTSVSARENGSSLCDDAFCAYCGRRVSGRAGGQASERATRRPGDRAGRHAGGSTVPWGWCGRVCTGLARAHQRAHGDIPTPPDKSLTRTYLSQRSLYFVHVPPPVIPATSGRTAKFFQACDTPASLPRAARAWLGRSSLFMLVVVIFPRYALPTNQGSWG